MRLSSLTVGSVFLMLLALLVSLRDVLREAHVSEAILRVSSDASIYFGIYEALYADAVLRESPELFLIGSPILFMKLAGGELMLVQMFNLTVMFVALVTAMNCVGTQAAKLGIAAGALVFPYFVFGFASLNKEVYAMSSAIFFSCYLIRGRWTHLLLALLMAACARYYMLLAMLALLVMVPRSGSPRWLLLLSMLIGISILAPAAKYFIPEYSSEDLLEGATTKSMFFAQVIDNHAYALVYPLKYLVLVPSRLYGLLRGGHEDYIGSMVSVLSLLMLLAVFLMVLNWKRLGPVVQRLIVAGFVAPVPIMWSEIMHWRYYCFVYFFFLFAVVLHRQQRALARNATG